MPAYEISAYTNKMECSIYIIEHSTYKSLYKRRFTMKKTVAKLLLLSVILTGIFKGFGFITDNANNNNGFIQTYEDETEYNYYK